MKKLLALICTKFTKAKSRLKLPYYAEIRDQAAAEIEEEAAQAARLKIEEFRRYGAQGNFAYHGVSGCVPRAAHQSLIALGYPVSSLNPMWKGGYSFELYAGPMVEAASKRALRLMSKAV